MRAFHVHKEALFVKDTLRHSLLTKYGYGSDHVLHQRLMSGVKAR